MTLDDAIDIQRPAVESAVAALLADEGLPMPSCFQASPMGSGQMHVHLGTNGLAPGYGLEGVANAWDPKSPHVVRPETVARVHALAHLSLRRQAQAHHLDRMPSWAVLVHPLLLAVLLSHDPDRTRMPFRGETCSAMDRWETDEEGQTAHPGRHGNAAVDAWYSHGVMQSLRAGVLMPLHTGGLGAVTVASIPHYDHATTGGHTITLPGGMPETLRTCIEGRALGEVLGLPTTGHADVDDAARTCEVASVEDIANGMRITVNAARLIPYGTAPTPDLARRMALAPIVS